MSLPPLPSSLEQMSAHNQVITLTELKRDPELLHEVQTRLKALGLYTIAVDGIWGPATEQAMDEFCHVPLMLHFSTSVPVDVFANRGVLCRNHRTHAPQRGWI